PSLFEVPAGYREVKDFSEAYAASASATDDDGGGDAAVANPPNAANVKGSADATGAKRAGVVRLGLVGVTTGNVAEHINASDLAAAVGNTLAARLSSSNVEVVRIEATTPFGIDAEAKRKECDFLIHANVSHKKGGGGFGGMLGKVSSAVAMSGGGYAGSDEQGGAGGNASAARVSASVKSKDELTLDLRVQSPTGASPGTERQFKAKAKSAGDDIISSVVEQAAQVVLGAAATK
ncbi:MAG TPA: hypothetical protein VEX60_16985, partial [Pyrinomonadaceae bacterium]|nr:hypothetical protein [Pyrinomonadaceae bacterium]